MNPPDAPHVPVRTCIGCRRRRPQHELLRCVLDADGAVRVDRHGPGRGVWLCGSGCCEPARRRKAFDRAWRTTVPTASIDRLVAELSDRTN
ncbi:MAG: YlxR family protein [Ilumatobacteraceae bacterium]